MNAFIQIKVLNLLKTAILNESGLNLFTSFMSLLSFSQIAYKFYLTSTRKSVMPLGGTMFATTTTELIIEGWINELKADVHY